MARIIKFRAKRFDSKEWVYGMLATLEETTIIIEKPGVFNDGSASPFFTNWHFVDKETMERLVLSTKKKYLETSL